MLCRACQCGTPSKDPVFCEYHLEKIGVVDRYFSSFRLNWRTCGVIGISCTLGDYTWDKILTLEDLYDSLYIWEAVDGKPVSCDFLDQSEWLPSPINTKYLDYVTVENWIQNQNNFEHLMLELERAGYLVTDKGGRSIYDRIWVWKAGKWEPFSTGDA